MIQERPANIDLTDTIRIPNLASEIAYYRENWDREGLPQNWADLPNIGFMIEPQMALYDKMPAQDWVAVTEEDVKGYKLEYPEQGLTFPIYNRIQKVDGKDRIVSHKYGKLWVDTVSEEEREGSVKRAIEKAEGFLLGGDGRIAVISSPAGWSGMRYKGKEITYPDSQTYIIQRQGNEIVGFTVKTDFGYEEHRNFIQATSGRELSGEAGVMEYVDPPIFLEAGNGISIENVVAQMAVSRKLLNKSNFAFENRGWNEIYRDILQRENLWQFDPQGRQLYKDLSDFVLHGNSTRIQVQEALALTILKLDRHTTEKKRKEKHGGIIDFYPDLAFAPNNMKSTFETAQSRGGCAGGGNKNKLTIGSITPRTGITLESLNGEDEESKLCSKCGQSTEDNHYHCPDCSKFYASEKEKDPSSWTQECPCGFEFACKE